MLPPPSTALRHLPASQRILAESGYASRPAEVSVGKDPLLYGRPRRPFAQLAQHFKELYMAMPEHQGGHRSSPVPYATPEGSVASVTGIDRVEESDAGHDARQAQILDASLIAVISTDIPWPLHPSLRCALSLDGCLTVQLSDLKPPLLAYQLPPSGVDYTAGRSHVELQPFKLEGVTYVRVMKGFHARFKGVISEREWR
ncbi:hypothetical protein FOZ62_009120 [Perkinsus olseni]|uniref:Uncharacterized protein n=1 Tax=Perkinsus olseni TaxID=32597 RepID=A0A7J6QS49_PEROL|nr:hypothetical protein FOZ62_009120 [Perkinsus olseni]